MRHLPKNASEQETLERILRALKGDMADRGRPKRNRLLSEMAAGMRGDGKPLKLIQRSLSLLRGGVPLRDEGEPAKPYYRAARRWADSGDASLAAYRAIDNESDALLLTAQRCAESLIMLNAIVEGSIPLLDEHGNVIPRKR